MTAEPLPPFALFAPPYRDFLPLDPADSFPSDKGILRGTALLWNLEARGGEALLDRVAERPAGVPLMVVLPPAERLATLRDRVLALTEEARPQTVLPHNPRLRPEEVAALLRREPRHLAAELTDFLEWRGLPLDPETKQIVRRTVELADELRTLGGLARAVYLSRRALGRRFQTRGLPVPSHWLQFCRLLRATLRMQNSRASLLEVACSLGYPDGFTLSNQMERLVGVRPTVARERLGWEWFVEAWLQKEWLNGGLALRLRELPERGPEAVRRARSRGPRSHATRSQQAEQEATKETSVAGDGSAERSEAA